MPRGVYCVIIILMSKILLVSDTHLTSPDPASRSLWPKQMDALPPEEAARTYEAIRQGTSSAFDAVMQWAKDKGQWDTVIHTGDVTGGWQEKGMVHGSVLDEARKGHAALQALSPVVRYAIGNHDVGYGKQGGLNEIALSNAQATFGPLHWAEEMDETLLIGVASPLAEYEGDDSDIVGRKNTQAEFVGDTLSDHRGRWMFFGHDPKTPRYFVPQIKDRMKDMGAFVYGDLHIPLAGALYSGAAELSHFSSKPQSQVFGAAHRKALMVPSTAPLWWGGHGLRTLTVQDGTVSSELARLPITDAAKDLPTANALRALAWMRGINL